MEPNARATDQNDALSRSVNHAGFVHANRQQPTPQPAQPPVQAQQTEPHREVQPAVELPQPEVTHQATPQIAIEPQKPLPQPEAQASEPQVQAEAPASQSPEQPEASMPAANQNFVLPPSVITKTQLSRTFREIEKIDDYFHQAAVRGSDNQDLPGLSKELESLMSANNLNILQSADRDAMKQFLSRLKNRAPVVHMSFPSEAGDAFLGKLLEWYRREAHPHTVLHIGLQPELAAGCTLRTTNKYHDFSFRKRFEKSKEKLIQRLREASKEIAEQTQAAQTASAPAATASTPPAPAEQPQGVQA